MSDKSVNNEQPPALQDGGGRHDNRRGPWRSRFTEEELRVFEECKRESLLYRALPLATLFGVATFAAVKYGYLKPNAKFGAAPKVILASLVGYGMGKFSYRKTCMKKMMALPNSPFGQFLKERGGRCGPCPKYNGCTLEDKQCNFVLFHEERLPCSISEPLENEPEEQTRNDDDNSLDFPHQYWLDDEYYDYYFYFYFYYYY